MAVQYEMQVNKLQIRAAITNRFTALERPSLSTEGKSILGKGNSGLQRICVTTLMPGIQSLIPRQSFSYYLIN